MRGAVGGYVAAQPVGVPHHGRAAGLHRHGQLPVRARSAAALAQGDGRLRAAGATTPASTTSGRAAARSQGHVRAMAKVLGKLPAEERDVEVDDAARPCRPTSTASTPRPRSDPRERAARVRRRRRRARRHRLRSGVLGGETRRRGRARPRAVRVRTRTRRVAGSLADHPPQLPHAGVRAVRAGRVRRLGRRGASLRRSIGREDRRHRPVPAGRDALGGALRAFARRGRCAVRVDGRRARRCAGGRNGVWTTTSA